MDFKFGKTAQDETQPEGAKEGNKQNALLVLLLVLVGGFSYLYFFTGLIRPQSAPKAVETPAPQVVKNPLPPRGGDAAKAAAQPAEAKKDIPVKGEAEKAPASKPAQAAVPAPAPAKEAVKQPAKPKEEPKKAAAPVPAAAEKKAAASPSDKKEAKAAPVKADDRKSAQPAAPADKKVEKAKAEGQKPAPQAAAKAAKPAAKPAKVDGESFGAGWTVVVGSYLLEDAMSLDMGKVRKAGLEPVVRPGGRKKTSMNRLLLAEYTDRATALAELDKLKRHTSDAFIIDQGTKHAVFAGSYLLDARAQSEKDRLAAAGFNLMLKRAEIAIPAKNLIVGPFADKQKADAAVALLKAAGLKVTVSHK